MSKVKSALEKLKAIPLGKRIKVSSCDTLEVQYVIWRTGEDTYKIEVKRDIDVSGIIDLIWQEKQFQDGMNEDTPTPQDFEPVCYHYETKEGLTAQQILELEGFLTNVDNFQLVHDIELHELYETPTETVDVKHSP
jgi:hypothetical protein